MSNVVSIDGIEEAVKNLGYNNKNSLKYRLVHTIRGFYSNEKTVESVLSIDSDELIKRLWDTGEDHSLIRNKRKNLSSIKSSINNDLERIYKEGRNPEGVIIGPDNVFEMCAEAKDRMLESFKDSTRQMGSVPMEQILDVLKIVNEQLTSPIDRDDPNGLNKLEQIRDLIADLSKNIGLTDKESRGPEDGGFGSGSKDQQVPLMDPNNSGIENRGGVRESERNDNSIESVIDEGGTGDRGGGIEEINSDDDPEEFELAEDIDDEESVESADEPEDLNELEEMALEDEEILEETDALEEPIDLEAEGLEETNVEEGAEYDDVLDDPENEPDVDELFEDTEDDEILEEADVADDTVEESVLDNPEEIDPEEELEEVALSENVDEEEEFEEVSPLEDIEIEDAVDEADSDDDLEEADLAEDIDEEGLVEGLDDPDDLEEMNVEAGAEYDEVLGDLENELDVDELFEDAEEDEILDKAGITDDTVEESALDNPEEIDPEEELEEVDLAEDVDEEEEFEEVSPLEDIETEDAVDEADSDDDLEEADLAEDIDEEELVEGLDDPDDLEEMNVEAGEEYDEVLDDPEKEPAGDELFEDAEKGEILEEAEIADDAVEESVLDDPEEIDPEEDLEEVGLAEDIDEEEEYEEVSPFEDIEIEDALDEADTDDDLEEADLAEDIDEEELVEGLDESEDLDEMEEMALEDEEMLEETDALEGPIAIDVEGSEEYGFEDDTDQSTDFSFDALLEAYSDYGYIGEDGIKKARVLSERFNNSLAAMDRYYNQYLLIPEGQYIVGSTDPKNGDRALKRIDINPFYLGKFPVTNALFEVFIEKTGYKTTAEMVGYGTVYYGRYQKMIDEETGLETFNWSSCLEYKVVEKAYWYQPLGPGSNLHDKRSHPVVQVSREDAIAFAAWTGKRLPTEDEWEAASRNINGNEYPWGDNIDKDFCNIEDSFIGGTSSVDDYKESANELGIMDSIGNVLEWTSDSVKALPSNRKEITFITKGGSWVSGKDVRLSSRFRFPSQFTSNILGFRCIAY